MTSVAAERRKLPQRRRSVTFNFTCANLAYTATASWFEDNALGEIFLENHRADSHADACAKDSAILASIALQYGAPLDVLCKALLRALKRVKECDPPNSATEKKRPPLRLGTGDGGQGSMQQRRP